MICGDDGGGVIVVLVAFGLRRLILAEADGDDRSVAERQEEK